MMDSTGKIHARCFPFQKFKNSVFPSESSISRDSFDVSKYNQCSVKDTIQIREINLCLIFMAFNRPCSQTHVIRSKLQKQGNFLLKPKTSRHISHGERGLQSRLLPLSHHFLESSFLPSLLIIYCIYHRKSRLFHCLESKFRRNSSH